VATTVNLFENLTAQSAEVIERFWTEKGVQI